MTYTSQAVCNLEYCGSLIYNYIVYNTIGDIPSQIKDKFCLDLNEEEAVQHIQALIDESVKAMMAVFVEQIHKWAQVKAVQYIMQ